MAAELFFNMTVQSNPTRIDVPIFAAFVGYLQSNQIQYNYEYVSNMGKLIFPSNVNTSVIYNGNECNINNYAVVMIHNGFRMGAAENAACRITFPLNDTRTLANEFNIVTYAWEQNINFIRIIIDPTQNPIIRFELLDQHPRNGSNYFTVIDNYFDSENYDTTNIVNIALAQNPPPKSTNQQNAARYNQKKSQQTTTGVLPSSIYSSIGKNFIRGNFNKHKNIILYGPPGTGKTLYTKELSSIIAKNDSVINNFDAEYRNLVNSNQIIFTTFHQSYAYEEFMEGIKPIVNGGQVIYQVRDGVFKRLSKIALADYYGINSINGIPLDRLLVSENEEDYNVLKNLLNYLMNLDLRNTDQLLEQEDNEQEDNEQEDNEQEDNEQEDNEQEDNEQEFTFPCYKATFKKREICNYVLIIDEINRGNISQIFGELITLIEGDKRYNQSNMLSVTLPYSGETFVVPPNLWIIGTMNTADKSAESLDTALRRRFIFIEMPPVYQHLNTIDIDNINLGKMLKNINDRIYLLKGKEFEIGHGYFTGLTNNNTIQDIHNIISYSILPLLQEYFYNDYKKIRYVLGEAFASNTFADPVVLRTFTEPQGGNWDSEWNSGYISQSDEFIEVVRPVDQNIILAIQGIIPIDAAGQGEAPAAGQGEAPAAGQGETPAPDQGETPAPDQGE